MGTAIDFEGLAQKLAAARGILKESVQTLEAEISFQKKQQLPAIRKWAENAAQKAENLKAAIEENKEYFEKPKTRTYHGIRFGLVKQRGEIVWADEEKVITLIRKNYPEQEDSLIKTKESLVKAALAMLPGADLKKLGVTVESDTDEVFIKATDSEIDKIVNAILKDESSEW